MHLVSSFTWIRTSWSDLNSCRLLIQTWFFTFSGVGALSSTTIGKGGVGSTVGGGELWTGWWPSVVVDQTCHGWDMHAGIGCSFALLLTNFAFICWHMSVLHILPDFFIHIFFQKKCDRILLCFICMYRCRSYLGRDKTVEEITLHDMDNHDVVTAKIHLATNYTCNSQMAWLKNACFFLL